VILYFGGEKLLQEELLNKNAIYFKKDIEEDLARIYSVLKKDSDIVAYAVAFMIYK